MKKCMLLLLLIGLVACSNTESGRITKMEAGYGPTVSDKNYKEVENGTDYAVVKEMSATAEAKISLVASQTQPQQSSQKKIIKDGRMGLQVTDLDRTKKQIDSLVKTLGGYYANENLRNSDNQSGYEMSIRIPNANFERFIETAQKGNNKVIYKEISSRDITQEYYDVETRLKSKRNALARYNEIMKRANAMKDIIELQEAIRNLQEEIESAEGNLRYMNDCVDYSTLNLTISTEKDFSYQPEKRYPFWEKFKESVTEGWFSLVDFVFELFGMWPNLLIIIPLYFIIRRWIKRLRAKRKTE